MIPTDRGERFLRIFEAAKRSLLVYDRTHTALWARLRAIEPMIKTHGNVDDATQEALIASMTLVDFAHRFAQLADALPMVPKRSAEMRGLAAEASHAENARHHLQHMRGDLADPTSAKHPILGSLTWANGDTSFILSFTQDRAEQCSLLYDTQERRWVREIQYTVLDINVDFDAMHRAMHRVYDWLAAAVETTPADFMELKWAATFAGHFTAGNDFQPE